MQPQPVPSTRTCVEAGGCFAGVVRLNVCIGIMGKPMALNLLKGGHELYACSLADVPRTRFNTAA